MNAAAIRIARSEAKPVSRKVSSPPISPMKRSRKSLALANLRGMQSPALQSLQNVQQSSNSPPVWCVVGGSYRLISVVLTHQCPLGLLVSAPLLLCEGRRFEPPLGRGKTTMLTCCESTKFGCDVCQLTSLG
jgi:hypothetical protein